jgi:hypothetical protein
MKRLDIMQCLKPPKGLHDFHTNVDPAYQLLKFINLIDWVVFDCALERFFSFISYWKSGEIF